MQTRLFTASRAHRASTSAWIALIGWLIATPITALQADSIYQTRDAEGNLVFTDRPTPEATLVKPPPINVSGSPVDATQAQRDAAAAQHAETESGNPATVRKNRDTRPALTDTGETATRKTPAKPMPKVTAAPTPPVAKPSDAPEAKAKKIADPKIPTRLAIVQPEQDNTLIDPEKPVLVKLESTPVAVAESGLTAELWMDGKRVVQGNRAELQLPIPYRGTHELKARLVDTEGALVVESSIITIHIRQHIAGRE